MYRLLDAGETLQEGDELLPGGVFYRWEPIAKFGEPIPKHLIVRRKIEGNAESPSHSAEHTQPAISACDKYMCEVLVAGSTTWSAFLEYRKWLQKQQAAA